MNIIRTKLTTREAKKLLTDNNCGSRQDKLKTLYQYARGNWITQTQFVELMEDVFGLKIK